MIDGSGIRKYLDLVVGCDMVKKEKPDPEMLLTTLEKLGILKNNAIMVGDTKKDTEAAKNADIKSVIYVTDGISADYKINDMRDLLDIIGDL